VGEKQVTSIRLRVFGKAGHASVPTRADNPLRHAAVAIDRLLHHQPDAALGPATERVLSVLGAPEGSDDDAIAWAAEQHPMLADLMPAMTRMTVTPTGLETFEPPNVIPPFVDVICDCRALAGQSSSDIRRHVGDALGDKLRYQLELLEPLEGGTESPIDTPLYRMLEQYVAERLPGALLLPIISAGFSDSHWVRREHGTVAYGFAPLLSLDADAYGRADHGADESIQVADLVEMTEFHLRAVRAEYPSEPT
jgi:carboxypeptidase PM20D1